MAKSKVKRVVKFLETVMRKNNLQASQIILFGSHASGHASDESDIDLVIISKDFRKKNIFERADLIKDAEIATIKKFMVPLDIIMMTPEEFKKGTSLIAAYAKKGKVLYAA